MAVREFDFDERLRMSEGYAGGAGVRGILLDCIPGALHAYKAAKANDRMGVDWWVEMSSGHHLAVDLKVRQEDFSTKNPPRDDLALETLSVVEANKVGWTRDENKRCDYILFLWQDTGRYCLMPFPLLCRVFQQNWETWRAQFKPCQQSTRGAYGTYRSECVFVPRKLVWQEIYKTYGGDQRVTTSASPMTATVRALEIPPAPTISCVGSQYTFTLTPESP